MGSKYVVRLVALNLELEVVCVNVVSEGSVVIEKSIVISGWAH
jgi:hypothetical protein